MSPSIEDNILFQQEEDIAHSQSRLSEDEDRTNLSHRKGKGKERDVRGHSPSLGASSDHLDDMVYPPVSEDAEETRRVEENLRRWEIAERQRRKAARQSTHTPTPSLVNDVSRRASLLWTSRKTKHSSIGGSHTALQSEDTIDIVPLTDIAVSPTPSPTRTNSDDYHVPDPFANPPETLLSPFSDVHRTNVHLAFRSSLDPNTSPKPPELLSNSIAPRLPPLPKPLNLPPPRTPPPIVGPFSPPPLHDGHNRPEDTQDVRWWHDWLCGCGEGHDRGGDYQAGRTNPFE